jgi:hypothetical protein
MNNALKLYYYLKLYLFTIFSNISPNNKLKSHIVNFLKSAFFNIKYSYKNIFKTNNHMNFKYSSGSYWNRCINHLNFVGRYYDHDKIHMSPAINLTVININYKNRKIEDLSDNLFNNERLKYNSKIINEIFKDAKYYNILQWFGTHYYTFSEKVINRKQLDICKNSSILDIGPGLSLNSLLYSDLNNKNIIFYDLEPMSVIQKKIENLIRQKRNINKIEYYNDIYNLEKSLFSKDYILFSSYAFSEFPIVLRKKFEDVIKRSKLSIFLSNNKFENVDNNKYFSEVSKKLQKNLIVKNFQYPSQDGYTKKHKYFILDN